MCEMQKCLPSTFFNAQEHYLMYQVEETGLCGPIQLRSMWMVERHLNVLKALVQQRACLECSMIEEYMAYQMMVYVTQYLPNLVAKSHIVCIWDVNSIKKIEGGYLVGKGRFRKVKVTKL